MAFINDNVYRAVVIVLLLTICALSIYDVATFTNREGWDNPYAARLVQCASDGLPGTQSGANCWGQLGSQGCPPGLPKCAPGEGFLGNGHGEPPVFYSLGNEQVVAKSTRPSSRNNNLRKHKGAVEGYTLQQPSGGGALINADTLSINPWSATEKFNDVATAISDDIYGPESYINY